MPQSIAEAIAQHAVRNPNQPAIVGTQFAPFSFRELDLWIKRIGDQLHAAGIGHYSRVGIMLPRGPEGAVLGVAIAAHAISVPLNSNRPETEIKEELTRAGLDALVLPNWVDSPVWALARKCSFGLIEASRAAGSLSSVALRPVREIPVLVPRPVNLALDSIALIFTTSGTTGSPKLVPVTNETLLVRAEKRRQCFNLSPEVRPVFFFPGFYGAAIKFPPLAPLLLGGSVGLPATRRIQNLVEWVPELCPT